MSKHKRTRIHPALICSHCGEMNVTHTLTPERPDFNMMRKCHSCGKETRDCKKLRRRAPREDRRDELTNSAA
jgi:uncharacterized Zn finger protein